MPTPEFDPELEQDVREAAVERVAAGFAGDAQIVEEIVEYFADSAEDDEVRPIAEKATADAIAAHLAAQQHWPAVTDNDKLDRAFAALEADGIVARQNFTCCQTCGQAEIGDEIADAPARGYVFFHMQDTDSAVAGRGLYLSYGAFAEGEDAVGVAQAIVAALKRQRMTVEWNGTASKRIWVALDWKKRRSSVLTG